MRKNLPTKLYANNGDEITIRTWESGGGEMPRKAQKAINEFDILINGEKHRVFYNISTKAQVDYYYLKYKDRWHWTRDNIHKHSEYKLGT